MSKSKGVVVVGVRVRRTGALVRLLCQIAAVRARIRWVMREQTPAGCGRRGPRGRAVL